MHEYVFLCRNGAVVRANSAPASRGVWYVAARSLSEMSSSESNIIIHVDNINKNHGAWPAGFGVGWGRLGADTRTARLYYDSSHRTGPALAARSSAAARRARGRATRVQGKSESRDMGLKIHVYKVAAGVAARPQLCQQLAANPNPRETSDGLRLPWSSPATSTVLTA